MDKLVRADAADMTLKEKRTRKRNPLDKKLVKEIMRQRIMRHLTPLLQAQMALAQGTAMLYRVRRDKNGREQKAEMVTSPETVYKFLAGELEGKEEEYFYIHTREPDNAALTNLLDRAFDKPTDTKEETVNHTFSLIAIARSAGLIDGNKDVLMLDAPPLQAPRD